MNSEMRMDQNPRHRCHSKNGCTQFQLFTFLHECNSAPFTVDATIRDMDLSGSAIPHLPPYWSTEFTCDMPRAHIDIAACSLQSGDSPDWRVAVSTIWPSKSSNGSLSPGFHCWGCSYGKNIDVCMYRFVYVYIFLN